MVVVLLPGRARHMEGTRATIGHTGVLKSKFQLTLPGKVNVSSTTPPAACARVSPHRCTQLRCVQQYVGAITLPCWYIFCSTCACFATNIRIFLRRRALLVPFAPDTSHCCGCVTTAAATAAGEGQQLQEVPVVEEETLVTPCGRRRRRGRSVPLLRSIVCLR